MMTKKMPLANTMIICMMNIENEVKKVFLKVAAGEIEPEIWVVSKSGKIRIG